MLRGINARRDLLSHLQCANFSLHNKGIIFVIGRKDKNIIGNKSMGNGRRKSLYYH